ncbi:MAG: hypothetical protein KAJ34_07490 [Thermodesulfovibrionia bacterium]|nr:hypothetical protein [Thermodesulfovibrionia bacterium]MCK5511735.1 hypothetical protein [Thermodesulfovibrionia bacterium]
MNIFERNLEDPKRFRKIKRIFYISLVLIAVAEIAVIYVFHLGHGHFFFENLPVFGSVYGFISCVLIIVVSKFLGHMWLMKKEDYYD